MGGNCPQTKRNAVRSKIKRVYGLVLLRDSPTIFAKRAIFEKKGGKRGKSLPSGTLRRKGVENLVCMP